STARILPALTGLFSTGTPRPCSCLRHWSLRSAVIITTGIVSPKRSRNACATSQPVVPWSRWKSARISSGDRPSSTAIACVRSVAVSTSHPHWPSSARSEEHTSELQSRENLVCRLLLEKKNQEQTSQQDERSTET